MPAAPMIDMSAVKKFIVDELLYGDEQELGPETNLIETGVIDSMSLLRLIGFLEERFGVEVPDEAVIPDNFRSLKAIEAFLTQ
ncbi:MAG TPA: acyl carrier protein [Terriglobales bacterium]|nr:acyl carrier protein [Terriglobales bacterium]